MKKNTENHKNRIPEDYQKHIIYKNFKCNKCTKDPGLEDERVDIDENLEKLSQNDKHIPNYKFLEPNSSQIPSEIPNLRNYVEFFEPIDQKNINIGQFSFMDENRFDSIRIRKFQLSPEQKNIKNLEYHRIQENKHPRVTIKSQNRNYECFKKRLLPLSTTHSNFKKITEDTNNLNSVVFIPDVKYSRKPSTPYIQRKENKKSNFQEKKQSCNSIKKKNQKRKFFCQNGGNVAKFLLHTPRESFEKNFTTMHHKLQKSEIYFNIKPTMKKYEMDDLNFFDHKSETQNVSQIYGYKYNHPKKSSRYSGGKDIKNTNFSIQSTDSKYKNGILDHEKDLNEDIQYNNESYEYNKNLFPTLPKLNIQNESRPDLIQKLRQFSSTSSPLNPGKTKYENNACYSNGKNEFNENITRYYRCPEYDIVEENRENEYDFPNNDFPKPKIFSLDDAISIGSDTSDDFYVTFSDFCQNLVFNTKKIFYRLFLLIIVLIPFVLNVIYQIFVHFNYSNVNKTYRIGDIKILRYLFWCWNFFLFLEIMVFFMWIILNKNEKSKGFRKYKKYMITRFSILIIYVLITQFLYLCIIYKPQAYFWVWIEKVFSIINSFN